MENKLIHYAKIGSRTVKFHLVNGVFEIRIRRYFFGVLISQKSYKYHSFYEAEDEYLELVNHYKYRSAGRY